ncbi:hypothetical protein SEEHRA36_09157, partial [Salmonella enterica subsp. enterica serovar Heidelberg str. SARA36]
THRVHINGFAAIAPARRNGNGHAHVLATEFFSQAADSAIPAIQVSAMTHSTCAHRRGGFLGDEHAVAFAMFM